MIPYEEFLPLLPHEYSLPIHQKDSYLQTFSVAPLISIELELVEFSIKIGEISYPVAAVKQSDDEGENDDAPDLDSSATKEIATGCEFGFSDCNNNTVDPDPANQLQKHTTCSEIVPSTSIFVNDSATRLDANVIFNASKTAKPQTKMRYDASSFLDPEVEDEKKLQRIVTDEKFESRELDLMHPSEQIVSSLEKLDDLTDLILAALLLRSGFVFVSGETPTEKTTEKATPELTIFIDHGGTPSSLFLDASASVHLTWLDFIFIALDLIHCTSFEFGLGTTVSSLKKTTERDLAEKETPRLYIFDPGENPTCIIFTVSVVAAVNFFYAISFPDHSIFEEMVKEMYLEESTTVEESTICLFSVVGSEENTTPPWKLREED